MRISSVFVIARVEKYGVHIEAWAPFGEGRNGLFENETLVNIGKKYDMIIIVVPLFFIGALAGFSNIYRLAKKIFEQESDRDTKHVKKTE